MSITCQVCATVNPDTAQFCDGCGVELSPQASPAASSPLPADMAQTDLQPDAAQLSATQDPQLSPAPLEADAGAAPDLTAAPAEALPDANTQGAADLTGEAASLDSGLSDMPVSDGAAGNADGSAGMTQEATLEALPAGDEQAPEASGDSSAMTGEALETAAMPAPQEASTQPDSTQEASAQPDSPDLTSTAAGAAGAVAVSGEQRTGPARLGVRKFGAPTGDFIPLQGERLVVGRFDASSGPVDIDLAALGGAEHISRRHAELSQQGGRWTVTDLGSTNGVFIKRAGQGAFSPRLQEPTALSDGDEVAFGNLVLTFNQD